MWCHAIKFRERLACSEFPIPLSHPSRQIVCSKEGLELAQLSGWMQTKSTNLLIACKIFPPGMGVPFLTVPPFRLVLQGNQKETATLKGFPKERHPQAKSKNSRIYLASRPIPRPKKRLKAKRRMIFASQGNLGSESGSV